MQDDIPQLYSLTRAAMNLKDKPCNAIKQPLTEIMVDSQWIISIMAQKISHSFTVPLDRTDSHIAFSFHRLPTIKIL